MQYSIVMLILSQGSLDKLFGLFEFVGVQEFLGLNLQSLDVSVD